MSQPLSGPATPLSRRALLAALALLGPALAAMAPGTADAAARRQAMKVAPARKAVCLPVVKARRSAAPGTARSAARRAAARRAAARKPSPTTRGRRTAKPTTTRATPKRRVVCRQRRPTRLAAPAPAPAPAVPGEVLEVSGTLSASDLAGRIAAAPAGPVTVRPAPGTTATVTGSFSPPRAGVALNGLTFTDDVTFGPGDDGGQLLGSRARQFNIFGADDVTIAGNVLDGLGETSYNPIWDQPAGAVPERFVIRGNTFTRFYGPTAGTHSEALYVGYSADGLIEGNRFIDNGTTAHVFFTWWGITANPATSYPRRVCVRGNSFGARRGAYFDVDFRAEIPVSSGIAIDPRQGASVTRTAFSRAC